MKAISNISKNQYIISLPTTGYTDKTVTIWGESKEVKSIEITADVNNNPLTNFLANMAADYPINISGTLDDFKQLYAYEIGAAKVTCYMLDAPTAAFNVLVREA